MHDRDVDPNVFAVELRLGQIEEQLQNIHHVKDFGDPAQKALDKAREAGLMAEKRELKGWLRENADYLGVDEG